MPNKLPKNKNIKKIDLNHNFKKYLKNTLKAFLFIRPFFVRLSLTVLKIVNNAILVFPAPVGAQINKLFRVL